MCSYSSIVAGEDDELCRSQARAARAGVFEVEQPGASVVAQHVAGCRSAWASTGGPRACRR
jgi:hypothetical protein